MESDYRYNEVRMAESFYFQIFIKGFDKIYMKLPGWHRKPLFELIMVTFHDAQK